MRCPYCQTENPAGSTTCENCGRDLTATTDAETPEQERGARVGMGVIALVLLVAAILVAGVLLFTRQQRQREQVAQATAVAVGALSTATAQAELSAGLEATAIAQATRAAMAAADSAPTATYEALDARYQRGISAAEIGDYATAVEEFRAVLAVDPDFADAASRLQAALAVLTPAPGEDAPDVPATTTALPAGDATPIPVRPTNTNTPTPGSQTGASTATPLPGSPTATSLPATATWTPIIPAPTATWTPIAPTATWTTIPAGVPTSASTTAPTNTPIHTPTAFPTATEIATQAATATPVTPTATPTATPTDSDVDPAAGSPTPAATITITPTISPTLTATVTATLTATATITATVIPTGTITPEPTAQPSATMTASPTLTPSLTLTPSPTVTASPTLTPSPTMTATPSGTQVTAVATLVIPLGPSQSSAPEPATPEPPVARAASADLATTTSDAPADLMPGSLAEAPATMTRTSAVTTASGATDAAALQVALWFPNDEWFQTLGAPFGRYEMTIAPADDGEPSSQVEYQIHPPDAYWETVQAGPAPDVVLLARDWFDADNLETQLTPLTVPNAPDAAAHAWSQNGAHYGLPILWTEAPVVLLRADHLAAAGLSYPDPGWNWDDLVAYAVVMAGPSSATPPILIDDSARALWIGSALLSAPLFTPQTGCFLAADATRAALDDLINRWASAPFTATALDNPDSAAQLEQSSAVLTSLATARRLTDINTGSNDAWLVAPLPILNGPASRYLASTLALGIPHNAGNIPQATDLLRFVHGEAGRVLVPATLPVLPTASEPSSATFVATPQSIEDMLGTPGYAQLLAQLQQDAGSLRDLHPSPAQAHAALEMLAASMTVNMPLDEAIAQACARLLGE